MDMRSVSGTVRRITQKFLVKFYPLIADQLLESRENPLLHDNHRSYLIKTTAEPKLDRQIALVTGGSGFIGRAISIALASQGAHVYVSGSTRHHVETIVAEISGLGFCASPLICNILDDESIIDAVNNIVIKNGRIDIFVNSAGGSARSNADDLINLPCNILDHTLDLNLRAPMRVAKEVAVVMTKIGAGRIVFIGSTIGENGKARFSDYSAAKSGLIGFMKSLAMELGPHGITVNIVSPGIVYRDRYSKTMADHLKRTNWLNRIGTAEDVSELVSFLCWPESSFITGQDIVVDGGRTLGLKGD